MTSEEDGQIMILHRSKNAPKPTVDKAVSAHFPDWDKPLIPWGSSKRGSGSNRPPTADIADVSLHPTLPNYANSTTMTHHTEPEKGVGVGKEMNKNPGQRQTIPVRETRPSPDQRTPDQLETLLSPNRNMASTTGEGTTKPSHVVPTSSNSNDPGLQTKESKLPQAQPQHQGHHHQHKFFDQNGPTTTISKMDRLGQRPHDEASDNVCHNMMRGIDYMRDPKLNKGMAFTLEERQALGIHGLIPPRFKTQEEQVRLCKENVDRYTEDLNKHIYLIGLQDRNERLFYRLISENVEDMMPLVYTPTVGLACQKFGLIFRRPRGLFITIHDKGHIYDVLKNWPENDVRAIVVTDGERILGLGDLGAYGMGIPVGKLSLYTALAGIKPSQCLPITLDVGTNTQSLLDDPYYIGLNHKRIQGKEYDDFLDEFMEAVVRRYGQNTLIQFEDFANHNAFRLLEKYRNKYCTFNDDIQGTASVALAGILASLRITKTKLIDNKFLFLGAGEAACGIADLILHKMKKEGATFEEATARIFMANSKGLLSTESPEVLSKEKVHFRKNLPHIKEFAEMVRTIKPTAIIGVCAQRGAFTTEVLKLMGEFNAHPVIFALSNPTSKAECTAEEAYDATNGKAVFASGSPFPTYTKNGLNLEPGQGNNSYIFPGVALATIVAGIHHISDECFIMAAESLANTVSENDLKVGRLYPPLKDIQNVSIKIATAIVEDAYANGYAFTYPEPKDKEAFIKEEMYDYHLTNALLSHWNYPESVTSSRH